MNESKDLFGERPYRILTNERRFPSERPIAHQSGTKDRLSISKARAHLF